MLLYDSLELLLYSFPFCYALLSISAGLAVFRASQELRPQGRKRQVWSRRRKAKRHLAFLPGAVTLHGKTLPDETQPSKKGKKQVLYVVIPKGFA